MPAAFLSSNKQDYATPWPVIEALEAALGARFTLDVCATLKSAKAVNFFTKEDNGLERDWSEFATKDDLIWCNPEYGDGKIPKWISRALGYSGLTTVFLLPANKTDQGWWADLVIPHCAVWDVRGRIDFLDPDTGEVPKVWTEGKIKYAGDSVIGEVSAGRWVKQSNPQASKIVIVGPGFGPCLPRSFVWKK